MKIRMMGIDYSNATIEEREKFSFTKGETAEALGMLGDRYPGGGFLIVSTCNRTELWVCGIDETDMEQILGLICKGKLGAWKSREDEAALGHLFRLACGLESQLTGEDQILTQIKEALAMSHKYKTSTGFMDQIFREAISTAKEIKTSINLNVIPPSAAHSTVVLLEEEFGNLQDISCLVIGNGQIGKLLAEELVSRGAKVTMTLRKEIHGREHQNSIVPNGCQMVAYEERLGEIPKNKCIISGTLSPHYTIRTKEIKNNVIRGQVFLDLAVPRDIENSLGEIDGIKLFNMDEISKFGNCEIYLENKEIAVKIIQTRIDELVRSLDFHPYISKVGGISRLVVEDVKGRIEGQELTEAVDKSVRKLLFGLRKHLPKELWEECFQGLEKSAQAETLKTAKADQNKA